MSDCTRSILRKLTLRCSLVATGMAALVVPEARAQWVTTYEQFYLQAPHNWQFRNRYQGADRLFNAFDYGHAILYETLWTQPNAPASKLEEAEYDFLTKTVLVKPPHLPLEEAAIEIAYARLVPEAKAMFDWAHILHRQLYDVLADESLSQEKKDAEVARLVAYYRTRRDIAFSAKPKSMELMQEQPYSLAFRIEYPKFNGLIWGYHWLQVGLYEPLLTGRTSDERQAGVRATVARFWQMLKEPPTSLPYQMPMTAAVAPEFARRYPEAAIIFDNLHSMHDVVSDILANDKVPRNQKRSEIMRAARLFRDDTSYVMSESAWRTMAVEMGVENMGGPAVNFLPELPTPTVTRGAVMTHDPVTGKMTGMKYGEMTGEHAGHGSPAQDTTVKPVEEDHSAHVMQAPPARDTARTSRDSVDHTKLPGIDSTEHRNHSMEMMASHHPEMMALHMRMMEDSVIRKRILADTVMRRMMMEMMERMPAEHREHMREMLREPAPKAAPLRQPATKAPAKARPAPKRAAAPKPKAVDPHAGHKMPTPKPAPSKKDTTKAHDHTAPAPRKP